MPQAVVGAQVKPLACLIVAVLSSREPPDGVPAFVPKVANSWCKALSQAAALTIPPR